ncbi:MAG: DNA replication/repair protein RecF [Oceanospirillales bacterium]|uniref:DNA replication and repair protein RecF n=1 Tax=Marinobacterium halophilum TaxID=267374 RepID=A0A2P8EW08_9GAMM|nr:DNA replication/repair protein RecF [Marinobacterium halophilum]MBR9827073.1 DNA replication/repair protein RecF [Oceanospirillales bacterium]PSL13664.1 DNA replication and repair protein RecF [Marinobacterium halophilum]
MPLKQLKIQHIRNLSAVSLAPLSRINILHGDNGSGKTSVLEAIHFLGLTRSFRGSQFRHLLQEGQTSALVFAQADPLGHGANKPLGVERTLDGDVRARYAGQTLGPTELAELLPLQVINSDTFDLLDGSPGVRRQFLDWGAFHADPAFIQHWRGFKRALKQRNSLLKCGKIDPRMRKVWDAELIHYAELMTVQRQAYIDRLLPDFEATLAALLQGVEVRLLFSPGWDRSKGLEALLAESFERDLRQGFTGLGPQRADIRFKVGTLNAADRLSRGQKKLVVSAFRLAQGALFHRLSKRACIYLIDDLPSELDERHCRQFCEFLEASANQCFITCVDPGLLSRVWQPETDVALFRVESGTLMHEGAPGDQT